MKDVYFLGNGFMLKDSHGDKIEVRLVDNTYNTYFKAEAHINHPKEMKKLIDDLRLKGVKFNEDWF